MRCGGSFQVCIGGEGFQWAIEVSPLSGSEPDGIRIRAYNRRNKTGVSDVGFMTGLS